MGETRQVAGGENKKPSKARGTALGGLQKDAS